MLDILDYTKQELISDADFWQFAGEHLEKPTEFRRTIPFRVDTLNNKSANSRGCFSFLVIPQQKN